MNHRRTILISTFIIAVSISYSHSGVGLARAAANRLVPGEKLTYELRWENVPAGTLQLEIQPIITMEGTEVYHFVMTARTNSDFHPKHY